MIDWEDTVRKHHALGLWYATRFFASISEVREPTELAHDAVQDVWRKLYEANKFSKSLFITAVMNRCYTYAERKPVATLRYAPSPYVRTTSTFPVQIFGTLLDGTLLEETSEDVTSCPTCGDE